MIRRTLRQRLDAGEILLLDGATGTELDRRGCATTLPLWSALGLIERPELVREIHKDYATAGADILVTDTFRTTTRTLARAGRGQDETERLNRLAVYLARSAAEETNRDVLIAGSIAPLEDCYSPELSPPFEIAIDEHREQADLLLTAGADFLLVETMPVIAEAEAATLAALQTGLEVVVGFVLGPDGRLPSGETLEDAVARVSRHPITAVVVNCSPVPVVTEAMRRLRGTTPLAFGGYANVGTVDETVGWSAADPVDAVAYASAAGDWIVAGAQLIGGCCGTQPRHVATLRRLIDRWNEVNP